jgi:hypothetical protein
LFLDIGFGQALYWITMSTARTKKAPTKKKAAACPPRRTNNDIYMVVLDVKEKVIKVEQSMVDLSNHVNHEIDELKRDFMRKIDGKLDADQLLTSFGFKVLNNPWFRWMLGAALMSMLALVAYAQWSGPAGGAAKFILRIIFGRFI